MQKHESNITAELYWQLRSAGRTVELEYSTPAGRLDLIVWSIPNESILLGVEVKNDDYLYHPNAKHLVRYTRLPFPIFLCRGIREIDQTVKRIDEYGQPPIPLIDVRSVVKRDRKPRLSKSEKLRRWEMTLDEDLRIRS